VSELFMLIRKLIRDKILGFILLRSDLPKTLVAFVEEINEEFK